MSYRTAGNNEIEVRVDLEQSASQIQYRLVESDGAGDWKGAPFQRADVVCESDALTLVDNWLDEA